MTTENSTPITSPDELSSFEADFFGSTPKTEVEETPTKTDAEDTSSDADTVDLEETNETEAEAEQDADEEAISQKPKAKQSAQERIKEINDKYRDEQRARQELERRLEALEKSTKVEEVKTTPVDTGEPGPDDVDEQGNEKYPLGEFDAKLAADRAKFHMDKLWAAKEAELEQKNAVQREQAELQTLSESWKDKLDTAEAGDLEDIRDKAVIIMTEFGNLDEDYGNYLAKTLMSLDKGAEVLNYLADNLDEARKIVASGHTAATIALGRIEARFLPDGVGNKVKPKVTQAPEPPKSLNRGSSGKFEVADDTTDLEAFSRKFHSLKP